MGEIIRNDLSIYDTVVGQWWSDDVRWVRTLRNMVPARLSWFDKYIDWQGRHVLDLGCAGGFMSEALAERGDVVSGIDPAAKAIDAAIAQTQKNKSGITYSVGEGEALPYRDGEFDAVLCVDVLEHVADLSQVLAEIERVLRPGGVFLYDTINRNPISKMVTVAVAEDLLKLLPKGTHDPDLFIKPSELKSSLSNAGLVPGPITGLGPRRLNRRGDFVFGTVPMRTVIYMGLARKPDGRQ